MLVNLISIPFFFHHNFSLAVIRLSTGRKLRAFGGMGKTQNRNKSRFSISANLLIFLWTEYIQLFHVWKWSDCVEVNRRESGSNFMFVCEKGCTSTAPSNWGFIFRRTHIHKTGHSVVENYSSVRKRRIVAKKNVEVCGQVRLQSDCRIQISFRKR